MTDEEKMKIIAEAMEIDSGILKSTDLLEKYEEWDSLAALSLVSIVDKKLNKTINGNELKGVKTVQEIMNLL